MCGVFAVPASGLRSPVRWRRSHLLLHQVRRDLPIFEKIEVDGPGRSPLYAVLTKTEPAGDISWNFEKFVVSKDGTVVGRFKCKVAPDKPRAGRGYRARAGVIASDDAGLALKARVASAATLAAATLDIAHTCRIHGYDACYVALSHQLRVPSSPPMKGWSMRWPTDPILSGYWRGCASNIPTRFPPWRIRAFDMRLTATIISGN